MEVKTFLFRDDTSVATEMFVTHFYAAEAVWNKTCNKRWLCCYSSCINRDYKQKEEQPSATGSENVRELPKHV